MSAYRNQTMLSINRSAVKYPLFGVKSILNEAVLPSIVVSNKLLFSYKTIIEIQQEW